MTRHVRSRLSRAMPSHAFLARFIDAIMRSGRSRARDHLVRANWQAYAHPNRWRVAEPTRAPTAAAARGGGGSGRRGDGADPRCRRRSCRRRRDHAHRRRVVVVRVVFVGQVHVAHAAVPCGAQPRHAHIEVRDRGAGRAGWIYISAIRRLVRGCRQLCASPASAVAPECIKSPTHEPRREANDAEGDTRDGERRKPRLARRGRRSRRNVGDVSRYRTQKHDVTHALRTLGWRGPRRLSVLPVIDPSSNERRFS